LGQGPAMVQRLEKSQNYYNVSTAKDEHGDIRVIMACRADDILVA
jgi:hypothetical protein